MKILNLFIDESGCANPMVHKAGCYVLSACLVNEYSRNKLKIEADQIKFKFWEKTDVIFHSREIWRKGGDFKILKDAQISRKFQKLLFNFLSRASYQFFAVVVDNQKAAKLNWNHRKVYKKTTDVMVRNFILSLLATKSRGRLVIESATAEKDFYFHKAASYYLSKGIPQLSISYLDVQNVLTEISFVTKKNFDIEEQIADLLAYGAKVKFQEKLNKGLSDYDRRILKIVNQKLFTLHPQTGTQKKEVLF